MLFPKTTYFKCSVPLKELLNKILLLLVFDLTYLLQRMNTCFTCEV